ncbi:collagenase-like [Leguminivora glycinivorella]|uniref:collagenase-like n=1 Tax=Leguminivora glycinivorella TaxID=1035111 RepID=UPI00200DF5A7|nr:collagenase-like [Leguminivora glycinivorella]
MYTATENFDPWVDDFALALVGLVQAAPGKEFAAPIVADYHEEVGIPLARRLKAAEEAMDFDGARLAGGTPANLGDHPYFVGLVITLESLELSACGSTLISNTRAVTAAHCKRTSANAGSDFEMVFGSLLLFSGGTRIHITHEEVEMHEDYNYNTLENDVAILKFDWIPYTDVIRPIELYSGDDLLVGSWAQTAGFGRTGETTPITIDQFLSHTTLQIIPNDECRTAYGATTVQDFTICVATGPTGATCSGDSGGPLVLDNKLIGITSFAYAIDCEQGFPGGFSRVSYFVPWFAARM